MKYLVVIVLMCMAGCGQVPQVEYQFTIPHMQSMQCTNGIADLSATFYLSGFQDEACQLSASSDSFTGKCLDMAVGSQDAGVERYAIVLYTVDSPRHMLVAFLAQQIPFYEDDTESYSVELSENNIIFDQQTLEQRLALDEDDSSRLAVEYALEFVLANYSLDIDGDGCGNFIEICNNPAMVDDNSNAAACQ